MLTLSIIVVTKDNPEDLKRTMRSIPSGIVAEVVLINAGNNHYSQSDFPHLQLVVVNERDRGISDAWNKGVSKSSQPYFFILNSGDELCGQEFLTEAKKLLDTDFKLGFVHGNQIYEDPIAGNIIQRPRKQSLGRGMPFLVLTTVFRKSAFENVGFFDLNYKIAMDYDWALRSARHKIKSDYINLPALIMDGNGISSTQEWRGMKECFRAIRIHFPFSFWIHVAFLHRVALFGLRKIALKLGMSKALATFKRIKHR